MTSDEAYDILRRPFPPEQINFRVGQARGQYYTVLSYLDARQVAERLTEVDPYWRVFHDAARLDKLEQVKERGSGEYARQVRQARASVRASLSLKISDNDKSYGTERSDVGEEIGDEDDIKLEKTVYSDALKRAAVLFGVGAYLYDLDMGIIPKTDVEYGRIKAEAVTRLRGRYAQLIGWDDTLDEWKIDILNLILVASGNDDAELRQKLALRKNPEFEKLLKLAHARMNRVFEREQGEAVA